jgi:hypothetical protein
MSVLAHSQEPLDAVVRIYAEKLKEITGEEPYFIDKMIEFNLQIVPDPDPDSIDPLESIKQQLSRFLGPIEDKIAIIRSQYAAFFVKFEEQAANGKLDKAKCVAISTGCVLEVLPPLPAIPYLPSCSPRRLVRKFVPCRTFKFRLG